MSMSGKYDRRGIDAGQPSLILEDVWKTCRTVKADKVCGSCGRTIKRCAPGSTTGTRGTKAWVNFARRMWMCLECHAVDQVSENARTALDDLFRRAKPVEDGVTDYDIVFGCFGGMVSVGSLQVFAEAFHAGTQAALDALKVGKLETPDREVVAC